MDERQRELLLVQTFTRIREAADDLHALGLLRLSAVANALADNVFGIVKAEHSSREG